jgi:hypothetical protein
MQTIHLCFKNLNSCMIRIQKKRQYGTKKNSIKVEMHNPIYARMAKAVELL